MLKIIRNGLASYGFAMGFVNEPGPYAIIDRVRSLAPAGSELDSAFSCETCMSFWLSGLLALLEIRKTGFLRFLLNWLASFGVALLLIRRG